MSGGTTPNFGFELLEPSQAQPEVPLNFDWNLLDTLLLELSGSITVKQFGDSPGIANVRELIFEGATVTGESDNRVLVQIDGGGSGGGSAPVILQLACSDLTTAISIATSVAYVRAPQAFTLSAVRASLLTASTTGGPVTVNIKKNGVTVLSTQITIDDTENTSTTAATPPVISVSAIGDDDLITVDIVANGTGAKGLIVTLIG